MHYILILQLVAPVERIEQVEFLLRLVFTDSQPGVCGIVDRLSVIVAGSDRSDCEGVLVPSPWEITKANSSGLRMACESPSCVGCVAPGCGLGV